MTDNSIKRIARNPKARHDYEIVETVEAGLVLTGTEIKSIRGGKANLKGAFGIVHRGEIFLEGMSVSSYESGGYVNHEAGRRRKLLLNKREIRKLVGAVQQKGYTLVPLDLYIRRGHAKVTLALGRGKKAHDKREDLKRKAQDMEIARSFSRRR